MTINDQIALSIGVLYILGLMITCGLIGFGAEEGESTDFGAVAFFGILWPFSLPLMIGSMLRNRRKK